VDLILVLLAATTFPVGCLAFVLWMGVIEDSIPAGVRRAVREPDPAPILAVPVRRTAAAEAPGWWESVVADANPALDTREPHTQRAGTPHSTPANPTLDAIPEQRTPAPALPTPILPPPPLPALPATEPLAGT
jgi:hypothetical protein